MNDPTLLPKKWSQEKIDRPFMKIFVGEKLLQNNYYTVRCSLDRIRIF
jgi:hypothetical protein